MKNWRDQLAYEMGWMVLPDHPGRGIATGAGEAAMITVNDWRMRL